jgi:hypothetical protein
VVQTLASSHATLLAMCTQPALVLHTSSVHGLWSSQFGAAPPTHVPSAQASPVVHALPSLQTAPLL